MDTIQIRGLKIEAQIGVHEWERRLPRPLLIDLEMPTDAARAAVGDKIADALDYDAVAKVTVQFVQASRLQLIETLAEQLAAKLQKEFGLPWLRLTVHKPGAVAAAQDISLTIQRGSRG